MGSFLDSNFSLDVVTDSPWGNGQTMMLQEFYPVMLVKVVGR
jgi:hypothetical protein